MSNNNYKKYVCRECGEGATCIVFIQNGNKYLGEPQGCIYDKEFQKWIGGDDE